MICFLGRQFLNSAHDATNDSFITLIIKQKVALAVDVMVIYVDVPLVQDAWVARCVCVLLGHCSTGGLIGVCVAWALLSIMKV